MAHKLYFYEENMYYLLNCKSASDGNNFPKTIIYFLIHLHIKIFNACAFIKRSQWQWRLEWRSELETVLLTNSYTGRSILSEVWIFVVV